MKSRRIGWALVLALATVGLSAEQGVGMGSSPSSETSVKTKESSQTRGTAGIADSVSEGASWQATQFGKAQGSSETNHSAQESADTSQDSSEAHSSIDTGARVGTQGSIGTNQGALSGQGGIENNTSIGTQGSSSIGVGGSGSSGHSLGVDVK